MAFEDGLRLAVAFLGLLLCLSMAYAGWGLRNTRQFGCYSVCLFAAGSTIGNVERLGQTVTVPTFLAALGTVLGLIYVSKLIADPDWRNHSKEKP